MPKRLQVYEAETVTVTFDPTLCRHAEECIRALPAVFDPTRRRWIRPERAAPEQVRAAVARCPSGALRALPEVVPAPASVAAVTVRVSADGPLQVRGRIRIEDSAGELIAETDVASFCRCGATANPPFCDGSHERVGALHG